MGRLVAKLCASSIMPGTDFTAKLVDIYPLNADLPAGVAPNIDASIVRARYRDSPEKPVVIKRRKVLSIHYRDVSTIARFPEGPQYSIGHLRQQFAAF
jgi:predicted acyl esterase